MPYAGVYRSLRFCKYLPRHQWQPLVLTIKEYPDLDPDFSLIAQLPKEVKVYRTMTIDLIRWLRRRNKNVSKTEIASTAVDDSKTVASRKVNRKFGVIKAIKTAILRLTSFPDHMIFWVPFAVIGGIKVILKEKPEVIYTSSPPHSAQLAGLILSKIFNKPWVADFRDPWVDANDYFEKCFKSKIYMRIGAYLESLVVKNAAKIIMVSETYRQKLLERYPAANKRVIVLTNGFDPEDAMDISPKPYEKFTITYTGQFYSYRQPDLFLDGFKLWVDQIGQDKVLNRCQVLFVGGNSSEVQKKIEERNLSNIVKCKGFIPKEEALQICMASHLLLMVVGFNQGSEGILTSKIFDYFLCKKPILAIVPKGDASDLIRKSGSGYVVSTEDPVLIAKAIDEEFRSVMGQEERQFCPDLHVVEKYDAIKLTETLAFNFNESRQNR